MTADHPKRCTQVPDIWVRCALMLAKLSDLELSKKREATEWACPFKTP
jgi:hypothetical protein